MAVCGGTHGPATSPSLGRGSITPSPDGPIQGKECSPEETPRKNKRKLSSPRKRTNFSSSKKLCPDTSPGSVMSDSGCSEDYDGVREDPPDTPDPSFDGETDTGSSSRRVPMDYISSMRGMDRAPSHCVVPGVFANKTHYSPLSIHGYPTLNIPTSYPGQLDSHPLDLMTRSGDVDSFQDQDQDDCDDFDDGKGRKQRKNYKNMTRERRVEANARERSRVHTISAAFDALRKAVPSYSYNQKLSKLAILRIASSYILALAKLADLDYSQEQKTWTFSDCVDMCTTTIQTEGRARRRH